VRASALLVTAFACMLAASTPARAGAAGQRTVLNYGDSLAVGTQLYLGEYLGGWRVRAETEVSRHAADVHHPTLHVLEWDAMARAHPSWFGSDGVHPSMTGYRERAKATARLVKRC